MKMYVLAMYLNGKFEYYAEPALLTLENAKSMAELIKKDYPNLVCEIEEPEVTLTPKKRK